MVGEASAVALPIYELRRVVSRSRREPDACRVNCIGGSMLNRRLTPSTAPIWAVIFVPRREALRCRLGVRL